MRQNNFRKARQDLDPTKIKKASEINALYDYNHVAKGVQLTDAGSLSEIHKDKTNSIVVESVYSGNCTERAVNENLSCFVFIAGGRGILWTVKDGEHKETRVHQGQGVSIEKGTEYRFVTLPGSDLSILWVKPVKYDSTKKVLEKAEVTYTRANDEEIEESRIGRSKSFAESTRQSVNQLLAMKGRRDLVPTDTAWSPSTPTDPNASLAPISAPMPMEIPDDIDY